MIEDGERDAKRKSACAADDAGDDNANKTLTYSTGSCETCT